MRYEEERRAKINPHKAYQAGELTMGETLLSPTKDREFGNIYGRLIPGGTGHIEEPQNTQVTKFRRVWLFKLARSVS